MVLETAPSQVCSSVNDDAGDDDDDDDDDDDISTA